MTTSTLGSSCCALLQVRTLGSTIFAPRSPVPRLVCSYPSALSPSRTLQAPSLSPAPVSSTCCSPTASIRIPSGSSSEFIGSRCSRLSDLNKGRNLLAQGLPTAASAWEQLKPGQGAHHSQHRRLARRLLELQPQAGRAFSAASAVGSVGGASVAPDMAKSTEVPKQQLRVGFLGLGIMGTAMARNLLKAGYEVTAWNRNPEKSQALAGDGAKAASSPREVTENSDITIAMLADPVAAVDVACGEGRAVEGLTSGKGYIDASTVDAESVRTIAAAVRTQGGQYLEAPVSGSKKPAEDGTLIFLAAGDKELFDRASDILDVLGKYKVFLGHEGNGASMKLVVNMVMGSMMTAFSEGIALGEKAGLNPQDILDVIAQGAISSPMFSMKGPSMVAGSFSPAFPLKHQQKDLRLALALGDEVGQPLPVAAAANEVYKAAKAQGLGDSDFSAVIEAAKKPSPKLNGYIKG